ncbi:MAG TPA: putative quinol monooxygenase [Vitreimonas sp.]|nr:putative quinol monooxygenase [Vitreimonas sp.]
MSAIKIVAILTAKPGKVDELTALLASMVQASRAEPGNLRYDLWRDQADANRFVLDELYKDQAAIDAHKASAHFQSYLGKINALAERSAYVLEARDVA